MKKLGVVLSGLLLVGLLAGCGKSKLTTTKTTYRQNGMVAVVKGTTNKGAQLTYRTTKTADWQKATVNDGTYALQIPAKTTAQTVQLKAKKGRQMTQKTVKIAAAKSLTTYAKLSQQYNQALIGMALPKSVQKQAQELATQAKAAKAGQLSMAQLQQLQVTQKTVQTATAAAKKAQSAKLLPEKATNGVSQLVKTKDIEVRGNVDDQAVLGLTVVTPIKAFKTKTGQKDFGVTFSLLANAVGADSKKVIKQFTKFMKDNQESGQTTVKTITSNGVKFNTGFSTSHLYIYMTK